MGARPFPSHFHVLEQFRMPEPFSMLAVRQICWEQSASSREKLPCPWTHTGHKWPWFSNLPPASCHCLPTLGFADGELTKSIAREKSMQSFNWFYLWLDAEVTADEMKFMHLNCTLHSLLYPWEMLLWERSIDARPLASSTFPTKAKSCDASENTATQQRASRISLGKEEGRMRWD